MATNTAAVILIPFMLVGLCYTCPIPGACDNLPDLTTYGNTTAFNPPNYNTTVHVSHTNVQLSFIGLRNELINPQPTELSANCTKDSSNNFTVTKYNTSRCPWRYVCDYNPQRIPPFIYHVECNSDRPSSGSDSEQRECSKVYSQVFYLLTDSCNPLDVADAHWTAHSSYVSVACVETQI